MLLLQLLAVLSRGKMVYVKSGSVPSLLDDEEWINRCPFYITLSPLDYLLFTLGSVDS